MSDGNTSILSSMQSARSLYRLRMSRKADGRAYRLIGMTTWQTDRSFTLIVRQLWHQGSPGLRQLEHPGQTSSAEAGGSTRSSCSPSAAALSCSLMASG